MDEDKELVPSAGGGEHKILCHIDLKEHIEREKSNFDQASLNSYALARRINRIHRMFIC